MLTHEKTRPDVGASVTGEEQNQQSQYSTGGARCKEALTPAEPESVASRVDEKEEIVRLSKLDSITYDRERETSAEKMGCRVSTLDKVVAAKREEVAAKKGAELCPDIEPCAEPVNVAALLDDVHATIQRFIVCESSTATATALWIAFTWIIDHVQVAPLAIITAPEKRCGKTALLDVIGRLSRRGLFASNLSPAATFRAIEAMSPTLLIDEADAFFRENEKLRGVINSGHTRTSAYVVRCMGDDHEVKQFSTWGAKAIAGIGRLPETVMDRAIVLSLRRKLPHEKIERLRHAEPGLFKMLACKLARFRNDHGAAIGRAKPDLPEALNDRAQDNWEPLLAIADLAGGQWSMGARRAALKISGEKAGVGSTNEELLSDIRRVFDAKGADRISLVDLLDALCEVEMAPWSSSNRGTRMTTRQLGGRLKEFGIHASTVHIGAHEKPKGFKREQFADAWARYLDSSNESSPDTAPPSVTQSPLSNSGDFRVTEAVTGENPFGHESVQSPVAEMVTEREDDRTTDFRSPAQSPENPVFSGQGDPVTDKSAPAAKERIAEGATVSGEL